MTTSTRDTILDTAENLIQRHGANGMSYKDISRAIGIRNASIHYHFPSKDDLLEALVERYSARFFGAVDAIAESDATGSDKLRRFIDLFEMTLRDDGKLCLCGMLGAELGVAEHPARVGVQRFFQKSAGRLARLLDDGRGDGSLAFTGDSRVMGLFVFSLLEGALLVARADGRLEEFQKIEQQLLQMIEV